jgi:uncharacterized protein YbjT (DUF2867 family)
MSTPLRLINLGVFLLAIAFTNAFTTSPLSVGTKTRRSAQKSPTRESFRRQSHVFHPLSQSASSALSSSSSNDNDYNNNNAKGDEKVDSESSRRAFLDASVASSLAAVLAATSAWPISASSANAATAVSSLAAAPICVIGANGKTGTMCVRVCLDQSIPVIATSRSGVFNNKDADGVSIPVVSDSVKFQRAVCDVTQPTTIASAISQSRAVIFAASASKEGGTAAAVDNEGLVNVAKACIAANIPHLVIVSSGGVSKPDSPVYKFLNLFGGIMEQKIRGEDTVRALYTSSNSNNNNQQSSTGASASSNLLLTYTIIRPGGLTEEPPVGVTGLELNQGDVVSGRISRADVASLCIESVQYPGLAGGTTFECYTAGTGKPLQSVGLSNIFKQTSSSDDKVFQSGKEHRGEAWENLFTGLNKDVSNV